MTIERDRIAGAILAGGRATRYGGANKAALDVGDGRTLLQHIWAEMSAAGVGEVVVCSNDEAAKAAPGLKAVPDSRPHLGPLAGVEAALTHFGGLGGEPAGQPRCDATVLLACDMPGVTAAVISVLLDAFRGSAARIVVAETADFSWQPLCSVVHNGILADVRASLDAGQLGVQRLWRKLGAVGVRFADDRPFFNVNTPEDMARWLATQSRPGDASSK